MKTFKKYLNEQHGIGVGTPEVNSVEDGSIGVHNIHDPEVLKRVNAFVGSIGEREYIKPGFAIDELRTKLSKIGFEFVRQLNGGFSTDFDKPFYKDKYFEEKFGSGDLRLLFRKT